MAISLKIKGNKRTNEGIGIDLVSIGDGRFPVIDDAYSGAHATDFIVVRHLHDKSIYTIVCKNVIPCDSNREGALYISVSIPAKEHVVGLFNMLIELQNAYKGTCMTYNGVKYQFMAQNENAQIFADIISRYKVKKYPYRRLVTTDNVGDMAYLYLTTEQISDLLDDPMRSEFTRFGQVVLVPVATPGQYPSTVNVPTRINRVYKIYVNGHPTSQTLDDPNKTVTITLPETKTLMSASTTLSIAKARETRLPGVAVDDEAQIIYINLHQKEKPVEMHPVSQKEGAQRRNKSNLMIIILTVCVVLLLGVVAYLLFFSKGEEKPQAGTTNTESVKDVPETEDTGITDQEQTPEGEGTEGENPDGRSESDLTDDEGVESPGNNPDNTTGTKDVNASDKKSDKASDKKSDKSSDKKSDKEAEQAKAQQTKALYKKNSALVNNPEAYSFAELQKVFNDKTDFSKQPGYGDYKKKLDLEKEIVSYLQSEKQSDEATVNQYKDKLKNFAARAKTLGLNKLAQKLEDRVKNPSTIKSSIGNTKNF